MVLKLDPRWPLVWRNPFSLQFGIDPPRVRLDDLTDSEERMLAALAIGVTLPGLAVICGERLEVRDALLTRLEPVMLSGLPQAPPPLVAVSGVGSLASAVTAVLAGCGIRVVTAADPAELEHTSPDLAVVVGQFVLAPATHAVWLRRDIVHLPVVASETGVTIGPIIEPGEGPCLLCLELYRRDADPAWPAVAAQLLGRSAGSDCALVMAEASAALARVVLARLNNGPGFAHSLRIDATTGARTSREWHPHPDCGCRGIAHLAAIGSTASRRRETDSPAVARTGPAVR